MFKLTKVIAQSTISYTEFIKMALCKIRLNYTHKVETQKANLNEYKRILSRCHLYEFGLYERACQIDVCQV